MTKKELFEALAEARTAICDALHEESKRRDADGDLELGKMFRNQAFLDNVSARGLLDLASRS